MILKRKVLHLYSGNVFGGIGRILVSLAHYNAEWPEMSQRFGLCFGARLAFELQEANAEVVDMGAARLRNRGSLLRVRERLSSEIARERPDLVICHDRWTVCVFAPVLCNLQIRFILWLHSFRGFREDTLVTLLSQRHRPNAILAVSKATLDAAKWLYPGVRREVIYAPIPKALAAVAGGQKSRHRFASDDKVVILNAASLRPGKGQDRLIKALNLIKDDPRWVCWLAGSVRNQSEIRYLEYLTKLVEKFSLQDRILFLGEQPEMETIMDKAHVYCHPNVFPEGFSIAILEACLSALPIIAAPYGGNGELLNSSQCGIIVKPKPKLIADALASLISDAALRVTMGLAGQARAVAMCDAKQQMKMIHSFLEGIRAQSAGAVVGLDLSRHAVRVE